MGQNRLDSTRHHWESTRRTDEAYQRAMGVERNSQRTTSSDWTIDEIPQQIAVRGPKIERASVSSPMKRERSNPQKYRVPQKARWNTPSIKGPRTSFRGQNIYRQHHLAYGLRASWDQCWGRRELMSQIWLSKADFTWLIVISHRYVFRFHAIEWVDS